jgi:hypothetical protein
MKLFNTFHSHPISLLIRGMKLRTMRLAGRVARMGDRRGAYMVLVEKLDEREDLEDLSVDGNVILKGSSRNRMGYALD